MPYLEGRVVTSTAVADLNGDGKPDLALSGDTGSRSAVGVLLNAGNGIFPQGLMSEEDLPKGLLLTIGDLNSDGRPDLVAGAGGELHLFLNLGGGSFARSLYQTRGALSAAEVGDLNGDGQMDLNVIDGGGVFTYLNQGGGVLSATATPLLPESNTMALAVTDFNEDRRGDLAVYTMSSPPSVLLYLGESAGLNKTPEAHANIATDRLLAGDANADGLLDLATRTAVLLNVGGGSLALSRPEYPGAIVAIGDLNGDGTPDWVTGGMSANEWFRVLIHRPFAR